MIPFTHISPAAGASVDDHEMEEKRSKLAWEEYSTHEHRGSNRPRSRSWMKYLWPLIPTTAFKSRSNQYGYDYQVALTDEEDSDEMEKSSSPRSSYWTRSRWLRYLRKAVLSSPIVILALFGVLHILFALCSRQSPFGQLPGHDVEDDSNWTKFVNNRKHHLTYPTDATRDVLPIPCHSHNDYWRTVPLFDALRWGCTSVEADVWHFPNEEELLVGHGTASLTRDRTFRSLYIDPLVDLLDHMNPETEFHRRESINGVFDTNPEQTLILLVDFKTDGHDLFPKVLEQLEPLRKRNYLSHWDGKDFISRAVTIVGTGNTPFDLVVANTHLREIFFDAPLDKLHEDQDTSPSAHDARNSKRDPAQGNTGTSHTTPDDFNSTNSYYASVPFVSSIGLPLTGRLSSTQIEKIRGQIRGAKRRGLKARYWDTPAWPTSSRNYIWEVLVKEGADVLNVDDLSAAAKLDWTQPVEMKWFDG